MSRQDANAAFALTSFLYGGNAAYVEDLHARYLADPASVDAQWQAFFQSLKDDGADVAKNAHGPSWRREDWPQPARSENSPTFSPRSTTSAGIRFEAPRKLATNAVSGSS